MQQYGGDLPLPQGEAIWRSMRAWLLVVKPEFGPVVLLRRTAPSPALLGFLRQRPGLLRGDRWMVKDCVNTLSEELCCHVADGGCCVIVDC